MAPQTLRLCLENVDFRLPTQITDDNSVVALKSLVFEPLLRWQPGGTVKPGLFASWESSEDARIWHFHIRKGAVFHDGKPCTADDVVTYINGLLECLDYFGMRWSYHRYFAQSNIQTTDDSTVRIENPSAFADVLDILCDFWPVRLDARNKPVLGTGPYRVTEFERHDGIGKAILERVDPKSNGPDIVVAIHQRDGNKRLEALQNGEVDVALNLERADDLTAVNFSKPLQWGRITSTLSAIYYLSCTKGIFESAKARLAANLAIDNLALVKEVYQGLALPASTIVSPFHMGMKKAALEPIPYDPVRARQLLESLDLSKVLTLRTPTYMPEHAEKMSAFVAQALEAVGFKVEIEVNRERPQYAHSIGLDKNIGDLACFDSTPQSTFRVLDDKISSASKNTWWLGYHDDEIQKLISEAKAAIADDDRAVAYARCLKRLQENPPWLYIAHPDVVWASRAGLEVDVSPSGVLTIDGPCSLH